VAEQGTFNPRVVGEFGLSIGFSLLIFAGALAFSCQLSCQYVQQLQAKSVGSPLASLGAEAERILGVERQLAGAFRLSMGARGVPLFSGGTEREAPRKSLGWHLRHLVSVRFELGTKRPTRTEE
jgi:hypothetical protein